MNYWQKGRIHPSCSPFGAPVILVTKKKTEQKGCALNKLTIKNKFPLPLSEDLFDALKDARMCSKMDLNAGFNQARICKSDIQKTAFRTGFGHFEYLVMSLTNAPATLVLTNAPATFMTMMTGILGPFLFRFVVVFVDDILVYGTTMGEHRLHLQQVLQSLRDNKLFLKRKKCEFGVKEVEYLGHKNSYGHIGGQSEKHQSVTNAYQL